MTDSAIADHAASERSTRRSLLGAGVLGAALAVVAARPASASSVYSDADLNAAGFAISLELTARDLYDEAIASGADGDVWTAMREQHESYAQLLAGITGISADTRNDAVFEALSAAFATNQPATVAQELENVAAATHIDLLGGVDDADITAAMASIVSMESRHSTVLALLADRGDDFDALFLNPAAPLSPEA